MYLHTDAPSSILIKDNVMSGIFYPAPLEPINALRAAKAISPRQRHMPMHPVSDHPAGHLLSCHGESLFSLFRFIARESGQPELPIHVLNALGNNEAAARLGMQANSRSLSPSNKADCFITADSSVFSLPDQTLRQSDPSWTRWSESSYVKNLRDLRGGYGQDLSTTTEATQADFYSS
ncbi:hypothetical protein Bbelb_306690 [Branchiostoma belcheri]|nr:hypothetical protein Bbelb_306690 [Branchiostoma belcheri]